MLRVGAHVSPRNYMATTFAPTTEVYSLNSGHFNGSSYIALDTSLNLGTGDGAASVWVKTSYMGNNTMIFSTDSDNNYAGTWRMYTDEAGADNGIHFGYHVDASNRYDWSTGDLDEMDGNWHHIVFNTNRAGNKPQVYVDGVDISATLVNANSTGNVSTGTQTTTDNINIGRRDIAVSQLFYNGGIAMIDFYSDNLTAQQVADLYNTGTPLCRAERESSLNTNNTYSAVLGNYNGNTGTEVDDLSGSGVIATNSGVTFTGTGLSVECT